MLSEAYIGRLISKALRGSKVINIDRQKNRIVVQVEKPDPMERNMDSMYQIDPRTSVVTYYDIFSEPDAEEVINRMADNAR